MIQKEIKLFKQLCNFKNDYFDETLLKYATPNVLGYLFFNRMQGVAFDVLKRNNLLEQVNREFRNSLTVAYKQNIDKNKSYLSCVEMLADILSDCKCKVAMLKGAILCARYPMGYRTSNDIDLLVLPKDITIIGKKLIDNGFKQGTLRGGEFVPASRKEIIESRIMRGETVPYIKEVGFPNMKYLEVDVNFSLDYKNGKIDVLSAFLQESCTIKEGKIRIPTLSKVDFFIHLCAHLYKEATTYPWIEMKRDMTLYKYADIYMLLDEMSKKDCEELFVRAKEIRMEKICAYAVLEVAGLFDVENHPAIELANKFLKDDKEFLYTVISPSNQKVFLYRTKDVTKRFFLTDRTLDLEEVHNDEKT